MVLSKIIRGNTAFVYSIIFLFSISFHATTASADPFNRGCRIYNESGTKVAVHHPLSSGGVYHSVVPPGQWVSVPDDKDLTVAVAGVESKSAHYKQLECGKEYGSKDIIIKPKKFPSYSLARIKGMPSGYCVVR